ncbi:hypothetical protein ISS04_00865 [Candidatus Woesearchaeota archaeon]|nr:hypothetical protein [Candidatus Woesearchaeota archaeon]
MKNILDNLEDLVKESPEIVLKRKLIDEPYNTILGMVRRGKKPQKVDDLKNELVYSIFDINKDESLRMQSGDHISKPYVNNLVIIQGKTIPTNYLFQNLFSSKLNFPEKNKYSSIDSFLRKAGKNMVENVFGEETSKVFKYSYEKHLQTKIMRAMTNTYFSHPVRVAHAIKSDKLSQEYVLLAFLHDIIEETQKYRKKKIENITKKMKDAPTSEKYSKVIVKINNQIKNPPELNEIMELFYRDQELGKNIIKPLLAISNYKNKKYSNYIKDMFDYSKKCVQKGEGKQFPCDRAIIVKLYDAIDNTQTLVGTSGNAQLKRLRRNVILGDYTYHFLDQNHISKKDKPLIWKGLKNLIYFSAINADKFDRLYSLESKLNVDQKLMEDHYDKSFIYASTLFSEINQGIRSLAEKVLPKEILKNLYNKK